MKLCSSVFILLLTLQVFNTDNSFAEVSKSDSLLRILQKAKNDTDKINALIALSWQLRQQNLDSALVLGKEALILSEKLTDPDTRVPPEEEKQNQRLVKTQRRKTARANYNIGTFLNIKTDYHNSLGYFIKALLSEDQGDNRLKSQILSGLGIAYYGLSDYPKALEYQAQALKLIETYGDKKEIARICGNMGIVFASQSKYEDALTYYFKALKLCEELGDKPGFVRMLNNLALVYYNKGDFLRALDFNFKALSIEENLKDKNSLAITLSSIGAVYESQKYYEKALDYFFKALKLEKELDNNYEIARNLGNIAEVLLAQDNNSVALNYNLWALNIRKKLKDNRGIAYACVSIGDVYMKQADSAWASGNQKYALEKIYPDALFYYSIALNTSKKIGENHLTAISLTQIGKIQTRQGLFVPSEAKLLQALAIAESIGIPSLSQIIHENLSDIYSRTGDYKKAFTHHREFGMLKDTLLNKDKSIEFSRKAMGYEYDKKSSLLKTEQEKKDALNASQRLKQRIIMYSIIAVLLLVISLAALIYRSSLQKQKANRLLALKSTIIEEQKTLVEAKNRHITDSIHYAKRIQEALLPATLFEPAEVSGFFVYHQPKDIVSGDFYWRFKDGDDLFFAVVDCTGHGVPGAMMSMLGYDMLEYAVKDKKLRQPALIIQSINTQMMEKLIKSNPGGATDGMDMTICKLNVKTLNLTYSGAKNGLIVAEQDKELTFFPADKCSVGDRAGYPFSQNSIQLTNKQSVYLFTDGYADQNGGPDRKRYMTVRFRQFLKKISTLSCDQQKMELLTEFNNWKGSTNQRDDVLVVGFKI
jgi:serine phosphatase RsbU (regulator of sigma subunit)